PLVWIAVVLAARVRRPFLTLLVTGALYGVLLGLVHQLLWGTAFPGGAPALGGNLTDLDPALHAVIVRAAAALSSVLTGVVVGALAGLLAEAVRAVTRAAGAGRCTGGHACPGGEPAQAQRATRAACCAIATSSCVGTTSTVTADSGVEITWIPSARVSLAASSSSMPNSVRSCSASRRTFPAFSPIPAVKAIVSRPPSAKA